MALINARDLDTSPPDYIVGDIPGEDPPSGMVPALGTGFLYGPSWYGKSLVAVDLGLAIANGAAFFGRETVQGSVAWCLGEGLPDAGVRIKARLVREQADRQARAAEIAARDGLEAAAAWLEAQPSYNDDWLFALTKPFMLATDPQLNPTQELRQAATELGQLPNLMLVILDAAADFTGLSLANDTSANRYMHGLKWLSGMLDCFVLAIAHPVDKGSKVVGLPGTRLFNSSDFVARIQPDLESAAAGAKSATILAEKVKSGPPFAPLPYVIEEVRWQQPPTNPVTGEDIPDVPLIKVRSAAVRQRDDELAGTGGLRLPGSEPRPERPLLPAADPVPPKARKRNGIRPRAAGLPAGTLPHTCRQGDKDCQRCKLITTALSRPAAPEPVPASVPEPAESAADPLLALEIACPACPARRKSGCKNGDVQVSEDPPIFVHEAREIAAAASAKLASLVVA